MGDTIRETTLRELIEAHSVQSVEAVGRRGAFSVAVRYASCERVLVSTRGEVRLFPNLTTLAVFLRKLGITRFAVDAANYEPGRIRPARPDRAEALRHTRTKPKQGKLI